MFLARSLWFPVY
jgi:hypothetical protein